MAKDLRNVVMFPEYVIALQKELINHPDIQAQMLGTDSWATQIASICTALDIVVDGYYDMEPMCNMLVTKLKEKRTIHIYSEKDIPK